MQSIVVNTIFTCTLSCHPLAVSRFVFPALQGISRYQFGLERRKEMRCLYSVLSFFVTLLLASLSLFLSLFLFPIKPCIHRFCTVSKLEILYTRTSDCLEIFENNVYLSNRCRRACRSRNLTRISGGEKKTWRNYGKEKQRESEGEKGGA